jgi:UDP:flavonoid glycosyltransferase YjiC (YdhE family)
VRVLATCSLGGAGHLQPLLPLLDAARRRGYGTSVVAPPALAAMVEATGHSYTAGGEPPEEVVAPIREQLPVVPARQASVLGNRELFGRLAASAMLPAVGRVLAGWRPDLVLRDPCEYASAVAAHQTGVTAAQVAIGLAEVEWGSIAVAGPALENHRSGVVDEIHDSPYLTRFPASLDPSPFPDTRRYREPSTAPSGPLPDWWDGSREPLVYMSFGTVLGHMSSADAVYRTALEAAAELDARVLLTTGHRFDSTQLGRVPGNVHVEPWIDQGDVLAEADLVVCHGGSGTTLGALGAGIPVVIVPLFADQHANGRKVAAAGAGIVVEYGGDGKTARTPFADIEARRIAEATEDVLTQPSYGEQARHLAAEMADAPTPDTLLAQLTDGRAPPR